MMRSIRASLFAALALVSAAAVAFASPVPYKIDPVHSEVGFKVRHFFTKVPGRFNDFEGTILLDDKYRSVLTRRGVRIIGARFSEPIDLVNAELRHELRLNHRTSR